MSHTCRMLLILIARDKSQISANYEIFWLNVGEEHDPKRQHELIYWIGYLKYFEHLAANPLSGYVRLLATCVEMRKRSRSGRYRLPGKMCGICFFPSKPSINLRRIGIFTERLCELANFFEAWAPNISEASSCRKLDAGWHKNMEACALYA